MQMKEAILRKTFRSRGDYLKTQKRDLDKLRDMYARGEAQTQFLHLRYVGYNKALAAALEEQRQKKIRDGPPRGTKRQGSYDYDDGRNNRRRV